MKQASEAYNELSPERFTVASLLEMGSQILSNDPKSLFSKRIPQSYLSSIQPPERLQDPGNWMHLPFPFVFTPTRKACLRMLLPVPQKKINIIEGFSQVGKSNLAAHLCLMYRCMKTCAVIYIGNVKEFENDPIGFLTYELFYWFFEEINENPVVITLLQNLMDLSTSKFSVTKKWQLVQNIMEELVTDCKRKGKNIIFIRDTFNKRFEYQTKKDNKVLNTIIRWIEVKCSERIFVTTNTDINERTERMRSEDISARTIISLDETRNPIPEDELEKLTKNLFSIKENDLVVSVIFSLFQGNLSLILLFSKYCLTPGMRIKFANPEELFIYYDKFKKYYQTSCLQAHRSWLQKNNLLQNQKPIKECMDLMMALDLDREVEKLDSHYLDLRYVYCDELRIRSINVFVKEMLQKIYWTEELIEKFINKYHSMLSGSAFGWLFDAYMLMKLKKFGKDGKILEIKTSSDETISLNIGGFSEVYYGKNHAESPQEKNSVQNGKKFIIFKKSINNKNIIFETPQENFPFADVVYHEPSTKKTLWINWRSNPKDLKKFLDEKRDYFINYPNHAKEQLSFKFYRV